MTRTRHAAGTRHRTAGRVAGRVDSGADEATDGAGLRPLGLEGPDSEVYAALVNGGPATPIALGVSLGLTHTAVAAAIGRLVDAGAARRCVGGGTRYRAVSPDQVFGPRLAEREAETRAARQAVQRLEELHRAGGRFPTPSDLVEVVVGAEEIGACVDRLLRQSRRRICGFDKPPYVHEPGSSFMAEVGRLQGGVTLQVVYDPDAAAWPGRMERDILPSVRAGEQARISEHVPVKLMLFDEQVAVLPVVAGGGEQHAAFVLRSSALIAGLLALFELVWASASPVTAEPVGDDEVDFGPLLTLLAAGRTDAGIARALGCSERTTQRRVQQLLTVLGARTRFQAGLAARERGWVVGS